MTDSLVGSVVGIVTGVDRSRADGEALVASSGAIRLRPVVRELVAVFRGLARGDVCMASVTEIAARADALLTVLVIVVPAGHE
jgi:hypothetical protein